MKFWMLGLIVALLTPVAFSRTHPQVRTPAKKSSSVRHDPVFPFTGKLVFEGKVVRGSIHKSEIDSLLARRVELGGQDSDYGKYGLGFIYEDGKYPAFSCQEWAQGRALGGDSSFSTYEITMDSFFVDTCSFLFALRDAKPAKRSFISNPRVGLSKLNLLPVNVLEDFDESDTGARISNLIAKGKVKVKSSTENKVVLDYDSESETHLEEIGRADFDGDGIEDIFVSSAMYAIGGTLRHYDYFLLTWRSSTSGFEVRKLELPALKENPEAAIPGIKLKSSELKQTHLTKQAYGKAWPFTVDEGTLACGRAGSVAVFFIAGGKTYPLNVWARGVTIDGVSVSSDTQDVLNSESLSAVFDKAFAMCAIK